MLVLNLLWRGVSLLLSLLGTTLETENQLYSRILRNFVIYQSIVISTLIQEWEKRGEGLPARDFESRSWEPE